jgi:radical SAM protein with 4Fe4S-binding SPASM domain
VVEATPSFESAKVKRGDAARFTETLESAWAGVKGAWPYDVSKAGWSLVNHFNDVTLPSLILRPENFGGSIFDPLDGTLLELDADGFDAAKAFLLHGQDPKTEEELEFKNSLIQQIQLEGRRTAKMVHLPFLSEEGQASHLRAPTLVDFQITNRCYLGCPHCYAESIPEAGHCSWGDMITVLDEMEKVGVHQVAIGGGEPTLHPRFSDFIFECGRRGIVPNVTTNGMHFDEEMLLNISKACGAVGMSLEGVDDDYGEWRHNGFKQLLKNIKRLKSHKIPTALQVTLSKKNFAQLPKIVDFLKGRDELYGVVFLAYKPVGRGANFDEPLAKLPKEEVHLALRKAFQELSPHMRVGFDCCMTPAVAGVGAGMEYVNDDLLEGCSAMRGSLGVTVDLDVVPCTFVTQHPMGNLKHQSLSEIWREHPASQFREHMAHRVAENRHCSSCDQRSNCMGGCPVMPLVNCHNDYQSDGIRAYGGYREHEDCSDKPVFPVTKE